MINTHKTTLALSLLMMPGMVADVLAISEGENIFAIQNGEKSPVNIIGKERKNGLSFFIQLGNNYHRVTDCGDGTKLADMLNVNLHGVGLTGEQSLQEDRKLTYRSPLKCHSSPSDWLNEQPVYLENFETYYFSSSEEKAGEYYSIKRDCGYEFYSKLFHVENRFRQFKRPPNIKTLIKLRCESSGSIGDYAWYWVEDGRVGGKVIVLSYHAKQSQPVWITISKINGKFLKEVKSPQITTLANRLNTMGYELTKKPLTKFSHKLAKDKPWFDICLSDNCKGKTLDKLAEEKINRKGDSYHHFNFSDIQFLGCDKNLLAELRLDKKIFLVAESRTRSVHKCVPKQSLGTRKYCQLQQPDWFEMMQAHLNTPVKSKVFQCPTPICYRTIKSGTYTVDEFQNFITNTYQCGDKSQLHLKLLGDVTVQGTKPIQIKDTFKKITIEGLQKESKLFYEVKSENHRQAFFVTPNQQLELRNLSLHIKRTEKMTGFNAIYASQATLKLDKAIVMGNASTALSVVKQSKVYCYLCQLRARQHAINAKNSDIFVYGNGKGLIASEQKQAFYLSGKSQAILDGMTLKGDSLLFLGTKSRAILNNNQYELLQKSSSQKRVAFTLLSRKFPKEKGYALSIRDTLSIKGIKEYNIPGTDFTMIEFSKGGDGSGNVELKNLTLEPEFVKSYLNCDGKRLGKLIFKGKDYCLPHP